MGTRRLGRTARATAALAIAVLASSCSSGTSTTADPTPMDSGTSGATTVGSTLDRAGSTSPAAVGLDNPATWGQVTAADGRTFITDARGRALQLRGFNIKTEDPTKATDELLELGRVRGFNFLRLSIYWDHFEPEKGKYNEAYLDAIGAAIDRAAAHGIYVVLDFHQDVYGKKYGFVGIPEWATNDEGLPFERQEVWLLNYLQPAVQAAWEHLYEDADIRQAQAESWAFVARRFKSKPALIGYDLLNEPFGKLRPGETVADASTRIQATQLTEMYQRLTDAIRAVDPERWILFEPPNVASLGVPVALNKVNGTKLIYFPHFYDAAIESATYTPGQEVDGFDPAFFEGWERAIKVYPAEHGFPMLIGEWGIAHPERPGMDAFVAQSITLMDKLASGWTVFNWCKGDGYCPLDKDGNDRPAIGQIVQPYARAVAGMPVSLGFDAKTKTLKVMFTGSGATGTTDIVIPHSIYGDRDGNYQITSSDTAGSWSSTTDPATVDGPTVVHVTTAPGAGTTHVVCIMPSNATTPCAA